MIEACQYPNDLSRLYVNVADKPYGRTEECAIYVQMNKDSSQIQIGDFVWWQGRWALWTPADRSREDVKIPRIGYSGARHPLLINDEVNDGIK